MSPLRAHSGMLPAQPRAFVRWMALVCVLLFGAVTTAQAAHVHPLAQAGHTVQAPLSGAPSADTPEHCPLCVALHVALPAPFLVLEAPAEVKAAMPEGTPEGTAVANWHFARLSRPPPPAMLK